MSRENFAALEGRGRGREERDNRLIYRKRLFYLHRRTVARPVLLRYFCLWEYCIIMLHFARISVDNFRTVVVCKLTLSRLPLFVTCYQPMLNNDGTMKARRVIPR